MWNLMETLKDCSPDQRAEIQYRMAVLRSRQLAWATAWNHIETLTTTATVVFTLVVLLVPKINDATTQWYWSLLGQGDAAIALTELNLTSRLSSVFPLPGKTHATADLTSGYGARESPGGVGSTFHQGYDYAAPVGTPVLAIESGSVKVWQDDQCGNGIELTASEDRTFVYCHLDRVNVQNNATVQAGDAIATVGSTGASTGPHLHIGIKAAGQYIDPGDYLKSLPSSNQDSAQSPEAQQYFDELSSGSEFGDAKPTPFRPMRIRLMGSPTPQDIETVKTVAQELNELGGDVQLVESGENVEMHFAPESQFSTLEPNYRPRNLGFFWRSGNRGRILIDSGTVTQQERQHLIREEMAQLATGLYRDSDRYKDSIYYQGWTSVQTFSQLDKQVIRWSFR